MAAVQWLSECTLAMLRPERIVLSGNLKKEGEVHRTWRKRWFVLVTDHLYYFANNKPSAIPKGMILCDERSIVDLDPRKVKNAEFGFELHHKQERCYFLLAESAEEKENWIRAIRKQKANKMARICGRYWRFRTLFMRRWRAVLRIQRWYRFHRDRMDYLWAVRVFQSHWRGREVRKTLREQQKAAVIIQAQVRGLTARRRFLKQQRSAELIQTSWRAWQLRSALSVMTEGDVLLGDPGPVCDEPVDELHYEAAVVIQAKVRGFLERKRYRKFRKDMERREKIVRELLSTEDTYVSSLQTVQQTFIELLCPKSKFRFTAGEWKEEKTVLTAEESRMIFCNLPDIVQAHEGILHALRARLECWDNQMIVGDILLGLASFLPDLYPPYVNNFDNAMATILNLQKRKAALRKVLGELMEDERCSGLDLSSFLIMPVQRIPRYVLLLSDFVKHTPPWHRDYDVLVEAQEKLKDTAVFVNKSKGQAENSAKIVAIQNSIAGAKCPNLCEDGKFERIFLYEGMLNKKPSGGNLGKNHNRHFFLFSDLAVYCEKKLLVTGGKPYEFRGFIPLQMSSVRHYDDRTVPHGMELFTNKGKYILFADDEKTKKIWMEQFARAVDSYHRQLFDSEGVSVAEGTFRHENLALSEASSVGSESSLRLRKVSLTESDGGVKCGSAGEGSPVSWPAGPW